MATQEKPRLSKFGTQSSTLITVVLFPFFNSRTMGELDLLIRIIDGKEFYDHFRKVRFTSALEEANRV